MTRLSTCPKPLICLQNTFTNVTASDARADTSAAPLAKSAQGGL